MWVFDKDCRLQGVDGAWKSWAAPNASSPPNVAPKTLPAIRVSAPCCHRSQPCPMSNRLPHVETMSTKVLLLILTLLTDAWRKKEERTAHTLASFLFSKLSVTVQGGVQDTRTCYSCPTQLFWVNNQHIVILDYQVLLEQISSAKAFSFSLISDKLSNPALASNYVRISRKTVKGKVCVSLDFKISTNKSHITFYLAFQKGLFLHKIFRSILITSPWFQKDPLQ